LRNVPRAARDEGHIILGIVPDGNDHIVTIRRALPPSGGRDS
jgi:hypothetical protein